MGIISLIAIPTLVKSTVARFDYHFDFPWFKPSQSSYFDIRNFVLVNPGIDCKRSLTLLTCSLKTGPVIKLE